MDKRSAWRQFCQTGRVEDYISYCKAPGNNRDQPTDMLLQEPREEVISDANLHRWDRDWNG